MTDFINQLTLRDEVIIWHAVLEELVNPYRQKWNGKVRWYSLPRHHEGQLPFITRRAKQIAQLYWQNEPGTDAVLSDMVSRSGKGLHGFRNRAANTIASVFGHSSKSVQRLNSLHQRLVQHTGYFKEYIALLKHEKPDVVFCSHQRSEIAVPVMLAAHRLGIPTVTFIYSWDNLPKGRMAVYADYYFVWSQHMKDEMKIYYPDVPEDHVLIVGTPQFEHYFNPSILDSREAFFAKNELDLTRPLICFSGDDPSSSLFDQDYLADLAEAMRSIPENERPQILFRPNPTETINRYQATLDQYPEIRTSTPIWYALDKKDWSSVIPTVEDAKLLANVVSHCAMVVNFGSTMALDFAILNKPAIYMRYVPNSWTNSSKWHPELLYHYPHFYHLQQFHPIYWVYQRNDLATLVMNALRKPGELSQEREKWVEFLVQPPLDQASQRCADALKQIAGAR